MGMFIRGPDKGNCTFRQMGLVNVVAEDQFGWTMNGVMYFPGVQSCTAVAVSTTKHPRAAGFHLTIGTDAWQVEKLVEKVKELCQNDPIDKLWLVGGLSTATNGKWVAQNPPGKGMEKALRRMFGLHNLHKVRTIKKDDPNGSNHYKLFLDNGKWHWKVCVDNHVVANMDTFNYVEITDDEHDTRSGRY